MKGAVIPIYRGSTSIRIRASKFGELIEGAWINRTLNSLTHKTFNPKKRYYEIEAIYYLYDEKTGELVLPRHALNSVISDLKYYELNYEIIDIPVIKSVYQYLSMNSSWVDRPEHEAALNWLNDISKPMRACNLQTGLGKTYVAVKTSALLRKATIIVQEKLDDQWVANYLEKTDITEDEIFVVKGAPSLLKLLHTDTKPKVIIFSIKTLMNYINATSFPYNDILSYEEFLIEFGVGLKIVDEFHLNFYANTIVDLHSNIENNIYLSATPKRSSGSAKEIFKIIYPSEIIGGGGVYQKYVHVIVYTYHMEIFKYKQLQTIHGYSHIKYENLIANDTNLRKKFMYDVLKPIIDSYYVNSFGNKGRLLILASSISFCNLIQQYLSFFYEDKDICTFVDRDPLENLNADIIVSTPGSCGTGKDLKDLYITINTISLSSEPLTEQILGRLRKIPNITPIYVDMSNKCVAKHNQSRQIRSRIYRTRASKYEELTTG